MNEEVGMGTLQTGSENASIFAVFGCKFGQLALPVYNFLFFSQPCLALSHDYWVLSKYIQVHSFNHWHCLSHTVFNPAECLSNPRYIVTASTPGRNQGHGVRCRFRTL
jgi:hypothetical protein